MQHQTRVDARTIRTEQTIRQTLEQMILEMEYNEITVSELTKRAGIHRKTFYLHYETIEHLFAELANDYADEITRPLKASIDLGEHPGLHTILKSYNAVLEERSQLHQRLFCTQSYQPIFDKIQELSSNQAYQYLSSLNQYDPEKLKCILTFLAYGSNAVHRNHYLMGQDVSQKSAQCISYLVDVCESMLQL